MRYPVVTFEDAQEFVRRRRSGELPDDARPKTQYRAVGDSSVEVIDLLEEALDEVNDVFLANKDDNYTIQKRDIVEGLMVEPYHRALRELPAEVVTDRDFWRYLATAHLFAFATWRDHKIGGSGWPANESYGCSARSLHPDTISLRMFNRGQISVLAARDGEDPYAVARPGAGDIWKSHILRTLNSQAPLVVRSIIQKAEQGEFPATLVRPFIKRVRKVRANVLLEAFDDLDAEEFVTAEREATLGAQAAAASGR